MAAESYHSHCILYKNVGRSSLAQMHVKHLHLFICKFLIGLSAFYIVAQLDLMTLQTRSTKSQTYLGLFCNYLQHILQMDALSSPIQFKKVTVKHFTPCEIVFKKHFELFLFFFTLLITVFQG